MSTELEKIDMIRERTGVSYKKAKEVLDAAGGDVVQALIRLEEEKEKSWTSEFSVKGGELLEKIKEIIRKGNVTQIRIKQGNRVLLDIPVTVGAIGAILAPYLAGIAAITALATRCTIQIIRPDGAAEEMEVENKPEDPANP